MLEEILEAIEEKNYQTAEELMQKLSQQDDENLWLEYCYAYLEEKKNNLDKALEKYQEILKILIYPNPKLMSKIRNGIERINKVKKEQKEQEINQLKPISHNKELAVLILEPIDITRKKEAAQKMARIMGIEPYNANFQIPTRSLRFFRSGDLAELTYYEIQLNQDDIPCFCITLKEINQIKTYQVKYIESTSPELILSCKNDLDLDENLMINYSEIDNRIEALLPLFDAAFYIDRKGQITRKKQTFDYAKFCDLHLKNRNIILRFSDYNYEFEHDINIIREEKTTNTKWKKLNEFFNQKMSNIPLYSDFTLFAEGVIQFPEMLKQIQHQVKLFRREETPWDSAFQLYSGLIFCQTKSKI